MIFNSLCSNIVIMKMGIGLYKELSKIQWLHSYSSKLLFLVLIGLHLPLLGFIVLFSVATEDSLPGGLTALHYVLIFTGVSTIITTLLVRKLLSPIQLLHRSIEDFLKNHKTPNLPSEFTDEIGILMKDMQSTVTQLGLLMETKNDVIELISHDLRSPATSMLGLIAVMENAYSSDKEIVNYCQKLKLLAGKQLTLTNGILESLKQEESIKEGRKERVKVKLLFDSAVRIFEEEIKQKGLEVVTEVPEQLTIFSDQLQIQEVLNNLMHNAVKFSHRGGKILLTATQENNRAILSVNDNGIGMEIVSPDLLFKRFTKYSRPGTFGEPSSGLGLFICRKIVEKNGGTITAKSDGSNKGSTFTINLPSGTLSFLLLIFSFVQ